MLDLVWSNLYRFVEGFVGMSVLQRQVPGIALLYLNRAYDGKTESAWKVTTREEMERQTTKPGWSVAQPQATGLRRPPARKDVCHCGSGKQYRKCCLAADQAEARAKRR